MCGQKYQYRTSVRSLRIWLEPMLMSSINTLFMKLFKSIY